MSGKPVKILYVVRWSFSVVHTQADALLLLLFPYHYVNAYIIAGRHRHGVPVQYNIICSYIGRTPRVLFFLLLSIYFLFFDYNRFWTERTSIFFFHFSLLFVPLRRPPWQQRAFNGLKTTSEYNGIPEPRASIRTVTAGTYLHRHRSTIYYYRCCKYISVYRVIHQASSPSSIFFFFLVI